MPSYDYKCGSCQSTVTIAAGMKEKINPPVCVTCQSEMTRIYFAPSIQFKGQGFNSKKG